MVCHVILFCMVLICKEPSGADEVEPSLSEQLNATLSCDGWQSITNVRAKFYQFPVDETVDISFTGTDLYIPNNLPTQNFVNELEGVESARMRHYMVTHLMGCIYVNEMVKFMNLLTIIFEEVNRAMKNLRDYAYRQRKKKADNAIDAKYTKKGAAEEAVSVQQSHKGSEEKSDNPGDTLTDEELIDFIVPWEIFNFGLLQFTDGSTMLDIMISTMRYLIDRIPSGESFEPHTREFLDIKVVPCLTFFKNTTQDIKQELKEYIGKNDPNYNDKVGPFTSHFLWLLNSQADLTLRPFLEKFCTVSKTDSPTLKSEIKFYQSRHGAKPKDLDLANQLGEKIRQLKQKVYYDYHFLIGFLYDDDKKTTSYAIPPTLKM